MCLHVQAETAKVFWPAGSTLSLLIRMKTTSILHRTFWALLPATLLLAACSKADTPAPAPADTGSVLFVNAAANIFVGIKALVNADDKGTLTYGANSGGASAQYLAVPVGTPVIKIDNAAAGTNFFSQTVTVAKDQRYSYFVFSNSTDVNAAPTGLLVPDDLSAPTIAGKAKIRLVHVAFGFPAPAGALSLSQSQPIGFQPITTAVTFPGASGFAEINPGAANLLVTTGVSPTGQTVANVGDGTGTGTGTKNYEAGKSYTIVVRGVAGNQDPSRQPKAFVIQNN